jgi:hypothetical protein
LAKQKWLVARKADLLPTTYFHVVFTIPNSLNSIALINQRIIYNILFKSGSETLLDLGKDPKHLGAEIGFIAVLHTWGQNLMDHPHLHCVVPGGGLSQDGLNWILPRKTTRTNKFFIHVNVISDLFKKKFLYYLKQAYKAGDLQFVGKTKALQSNRAFQRLLDELYDKKWVSYCKKPFGGPEQVLEYLCVYTHRVAISNNRLLNMESGKVTFRWRDYRNGNIKRSMTLDVFEFMRRFLLHILPRGFVKIRYYGILSSRNHQLKLVKCKELLGIQIKRDEAVNKSQSWEELIYQLTGVDPRKCPKCHKGLMFRKEELPKQIHAPP